MTDLEVFILLPVIGYGGLWILGSALFLVYFHLFHIAMDVKHPLTMIQKVPHSSPSLRFLCAVSPHSSSRPRYSSEHLLYLSMLQNSSKLV